MNVLQASRSGLAFLLLLAGGAGPLAGQVVLDGTLGAGGPLTGPGYQIPETLGALRGPNLFHSFSEFNLSAGESATFSGPPSVENILSRVTGGNISLIDGVLRSTIPDANLFLLNPDGVLFGPNAELDVGGSFYTTTADRIRLEDGNFFSATDTGNSVLTSAAPAAFGFLDDAAAGVILVEESELTVAHGQELSLVGGDVLIESGAVRAPSGQINLVGVKSAGDVRIDAPEDTGAIASLGDVRIWDSSEVDVRGTGGGRVVIRGGRLVMDEFKALSKVRAGEVGDSADAGIDIDVRNELSMGVFSEISSVTTGETDGGPVSVRAGSVLTGFYSRIFTETAGAGDGGDLFLNAEDIFIQHQSEVSSATSGAGDGGDLHIHVPRIHVTRLGGIISRVNVGATGDGGDVLIESDTLRATRNGLVLSDTRSFGRGGDIDIKTRELILDDAYEQGGFIARGEIIAATGFYPIERFEPLVEGDGGDIRIQADTITLIGGRIRSTTLSNGDGGRMDIEARDILVDGMNVESSAGITSETGQHPAFHDPRRTSGNGGDLSIRADRIEIGSGGRIATVGLNWWGTAGDLDIETDSLSVSGITDHIPVLKQFPPGGVLSIVRSNRAREASGGDIRLVAREVELRDNGTITMQFTTANPGGQPALQSGRGGDLSLVADRLIVSGGSSIHSDLNVSFQIAADGGDLDIKAGELRLEAGGQILSTVTAIDSQVYLSSGGAIAIEAGLFEINGKNSTVTGLGGAGHGAGALIIADQFEMRHGGSIVMIIGGSQPDPGTGLTIRGERLLMEDGALIEVQGRFDLFFSVRMRDTIHLFSGSRIELSLGSTYAADVIQAPEVVFDGLGSGVVVSPRVILSEGSLAGTLSLQARHLRLSNGALISAASSFHGDGGRILIGGLEPGERAETVVFTGPGSGITSEARTFELVYPPLDFRGGRVVIRARDVLVSDRAELSTATRSPGEGGEVIIEADAFRMVDGGLISVAAFDLGKGGSVQIHSGSVHLARGAVISSSSSSAQPGAGVAGEIAIHARSGLILESGSAIRSEAVNAAGGDVLLSAGSQILLRDSSVTAQALGNGGGLTLLAPAVVDPLGQVTKLDGPSSVHLYRSVLSAESRTGQGGNLLIDPQVVVLNGSRLTANAVSGNGGDITIVSDLFLQMGSEISASSTFGLAGQITVTAPGLDVTGEVAPLTVSLLDAENRMPEHCARKLQGNFSSFLMVGPGGMPVEPGGFRPSVRPPAERETE